MLEQWTTQLNQLLAREPTAAGWREICGVLEGRTAAELAPYRAMIAGWPVRLRSMPEQWWAQWSTGDERAWHRFATHRVLIDGGYQAGSPDLNGKWPLLIASCPRYRFIAVGGANNGHSSGSEIGGLGQR